MQSTRTNRNTGLFTLFFLSGFCSLLYQVVWMRIAMAAFGVITPVFSVVISVFMLGLFVGSVWGGKWGERLSRQSGRRAVYAYAVCELLIGLSALFVPIAFDWGATMLLGVGEQSSAYLLRSAVVITLSLFPWCVFMGMTFPLMMAHIRQTQPQNETGFSFLYLGNVLGAMSGTLLSAVVLIELLGFRDTLIFSGLINFAIAVMAIVIGARSKVEPFAPTTVETKVVPAFASIPQSWGYGLLFLTGFCSMAMEVVWTRAFTPYLQTHVYAFALLLFFYLLATVLGSRKYRSDLKKQRAWSFETLLVAMAMTAALPVVVADPRLKLQAVGALLSIFPFCYLLGYLTPGLIDGISGGNPDRAGRAYAVNVFGCILGPILASYLLLPAVGVRWSLLLLALPFLVIVFMKVSLFSVKRVPALALSLAIFAVGGLLSVSYEDFYNGWEGNGVVRRDHTATVISIGNGMGKRLLVNGVGITHMTPVTKVMAHLPLSYLDRKPESALVICFGMGTTYRSLMSWGIDVTAVELVPSVRDAFSFYFDDAKERMADPKARVVIDDGRRFLKRTDKRFDLITLDPPPPAEAAASSLLYSEEFYQVAKSKLAPGGILQQWYPGSKDPRTLQAVSNAIAKSFKYVHVYQSFEHWGHHYIASDSPIAAPTVAQVLERMPEAAQRDLVEWNPDTTAEALMRLVLSKEVRMESLVQSPALTLTDDRPFNEYFLIRRALHPLPKSE